MVIVLLDEVMLFNSMSTEMGYQPTRRELEVLGLVAQGKSSMQIGEELGLSKHTVFNHRKNMLKKSGCSNMSELVLFGIRNGLIQ